VYCRLWPNEAFRLRKLNHQCWRYVRLAFKYTGGLLNVQLLRSALDLPEDESSSLVPCLMALKTFPVSLSGGDLAQADEPRLSKRFPVAKPSPRTRTKSPKMQLIKPPRTQRQQRPSTLLGRTDGTPQRRARSSSRISRAVYYCRVCYRLARSTRLSWRGQRLFNQRLQRMLMPI
jgi:hypothetical protein